jgi:YesN/AraC family two-component response regulator
MLPSPQPRLFLPTVLVIDGQREVLDSIARVLRDAGFEVLATSSGGGAIGLARQHAVDLVIADLRLGDMTGGEVLRRLRRERGTVPVIVTGVASTASAIEAGRLGATEYLEKPVFAEPLIGLARCYAPPRRRAASAAAETAVIRASPQVIQAMRAINERYGESGMSVRTVARELGISTEHLCRLMKRHTGLTFVALLRRARVRAACHLLHTTTLSVKQIADRVGVASASRLDRDFRAVSGMPPSAYRIGTRRES